MFAAEARDVDPGYAPQTVNTDGWASTRNAFQTLFPLITVVLCFLHGFLKSLTVTDFGGLDVGIPSDAGS